MEEEWRSIVGYEEKYEVSNFGNVRNKKGKIMKYSNVGNYLQIGLCDKNQKKFYIHRLVLDAFLPINEIKEVNHKNHITQDNRLCNLEWCSPSENKRFQKKREGLTSQYKGVRWLKGKWRTQCRLDGKQIHIGYFDDEKDAGKAYNNFVIKHWLQDFNILNNFVNL